MKNLIRLCHENINMLTDLYEINETTFAKIVDNKDVLIVAAFISGAS